MTNIIEFPSDVSGMMGAITDLYREGQIRELVFFAPNDLDSGGFHFRASDGIKLSDVLMAKQYLTLLANALCEAGASPPPQGKAA
jgi:hypothetical protein